MRLISKRNMGQKKSKIRRRGGKRRFISKIMKRVVKAK